MVQSSPFKVGQICFQLVKKIQMTVYGLISKSNNTFYKVHPNIKRNLNSSAKCPSVPRSDVEYRTNNSDRIRVKIDRGLCAILSTDRCVTLVLDAVVSRSDDREQHNTDDKRRSSMVSASERAREARALPTIQIRRLPPPPS